MNRQTGSILLWILGVLLVLVLLVVAGVWYVRANPLALYESGTRRALAKAGLELKHLDSQVGRLAYWEGGSGPTLVLVHGAGDQAGAWQGVVSALLPEYRLLVPDVAGHGDSEPLEGPLPMSLMYGGFAEWLDAVAGQEPPTLVGHSMGAWLATLQAHRKPETVARVVAINGGPLRGDRPDLSLTPVDREAARTLMAALRDPASEPIPDFVLDDIVQHAERGAIGRMSAEEEDLEAHLLEGHLGEIEVPVDLLWGLSDQLLPLAYAERMAAELPRARITTIEGCGHHPANECPEELAERLPELLHRDPPPERDEGSVQP